MFQLNVLGAFADAIDFDLELDPDAIKQALKEGRDVDDEERVIV